MCQKSSRQLVNSPPTETETRSAHAMMQLPLAVEQTGGEEKGMVSRAAVMLKEEQTKPIIITSQPCVKLDLH